jgi:hypothetical protein
VRADEQGLFAASRFEAGQPLFQQRRLLAIAELAALVGGRIAVVAEDARRAERKQMNLRSFESGARGFRCAKT